jgi:ribonuclease HI
MELMAAIKALEALKQPCSVVVFTDSAYLANGISKGWARSWCAKGWRRQGRVVPNWELWRSLLALCERHRVHMRWVEGHAGHPENERCDELAVGAAALGGLPVDEGYELAPVP